MLFNTPGTTMIISLRMILSDGIIFPSIVSNKPGGSLPNFAVVLNGLTGQTGTNGIYARICSTASAHTLRIDDWDASVSQNWSTFLGILDSAPSPPFTNTAANPAPQNPTISGEIGRAIAAALQDQAPLKGIKSIEFFAVPSSATTPTLNITLFTYKTGDKTMIITVTTTTYDQAVSHLAHHRRTPN